MTMTTTMSGVALSGAQLKVSLQGLGLPPSWFANHCNVTMRTVVRWFDSVDVASSVAIELEKLSEATLDEMRKLVEKTTTSGDVVTLKTYRTDGEFKNRSGWPASWHRGLIFRVMEHFRNSGYVVIIEYR